jgi:DNA (cytosine-5)-methyltransferase 3A
MIQKPRGNNPGGARAVDGKTPVLSASSWEHNNHLTDGSEIRKLTPIECERLQGLPDNYTDGISNSQRYKCLGNAFNVDVVAHILSFIPR